MRILFICSCILFYSSFVYANECSGENAKLIEQLETKLDNCKIEMPDNATDVEMINAYDNLTNCTKDVAYQIFDSFYTSKNQSVKNDFNKVIKATYLHYQNLIENKYRAMNQINPDFIQKLLSQFINTKFTYVTYENPDLLGMPIEYSDDKISDELLFFLNSI